MEIRRALPDLSSRRYADCLRSVINPLIQAAGKVLATTITAMALWAEYLLDKNSHALAVDVCRQAIALAPHCNPPAPIARLHRLLGRAHRELGCFHACRGNYNAGFGGRAPGR